MIVKPFAALRPQDEYVKECAALPYDVMSSDEARELQIIRKYSLQLFFGNIYGACSRCVCVDFHIIVIVLFVQSLMVTFIVRLPSAPSSMSTLMCSSGSSSSTSSGHSRKQ